MRSPIVFLVSLIATALFAGCLVEPATEGGGRPVQDAGQAPQKPAGPSASTEPQPVASGPIEPEPAKDEPGSPTWIVTPVAFQGRTTTRLCRSVYTGPSCVTIQSGQNTSVPLAGPTGPVLLQGNLTWDASTYSTGHLVVFLMVYNGEEYVSRRGSQPRVSGESPLRVSFNLTHYAGQKLALGIGNDECLLDTAPGANCAFAGSGVEELPQDFSFKGRLVGWTAGRTA